MFFTVATILIILWVLFSDDVKRYFSERSEIKTRLSVSEKIAKVKELSDDSKDIEKFILSNASELSEASVNRLIQRIEVLKADRVITDDNLKKRIADISPEEDEAPQVSARSVRKAK